MTEHATFDPDTEKLLTSELAGEDLNLTRDDLWNL